MACSRSNKACNNGSGKEEDTDDDDDDDDGVGAKATPNAAARDASSFHCSGLVVGKYSVEGKV
jgi:hypothetical protein